MVARDYDGEKFYLSMEKIWRSRKLAIVDFMVRYCLLFPSTASVRVKSRNGVRVRARARGARVGLGIGLELGVRVRQWVRVRTRIRVLNDPVFLATGLKFQMNPPCSNS